MDFDRFHTKFYQFNFLNHLFAGTIWDWEITGKDQEWIRQLYSGRVEKLDNNIFNFCVERYLAPATSRVLEIICHCLPIPMCTNNYEDRSNHCPYIFGALLSKIRRAIWYTSCHTKYPPTLPFDGLHPYFWAIVQEQNSISRVRSTYA